ncbi:MAG: hypothetical protein LBP56_06635 [Odoribacteraceae bacterium]|jgi:hypothetical protein|nr:hypothetical protein [Odoribacteraceae bacterium]
MKQNIYKCLACLFVLSLALPAGAPAQERENTPATLERMKAENPWSRSGNAGGILLDDLVRYSVFDLSYRSLGGNFHRPQQGAKVHHLDFSAEGGVFLDKLYAWGNFAYRRENTRDANFNSSIIDPYRGMPYYTADLNPSDWENQFYDIRFKAALPLGGRLLAGIDGTYRVAQAAKQRDPRTLNQFYALDLRPGLVFLLAPAHRVGLNVEYGNLKENSAPALVNTGDYQTYYELYGLGTAIENIGTGRTVNYVGNRLGGEVQYNFRRAAVNLLLAGGYAYKVEEAEFSFTTPEKFGTTREKEWRLSLSLDLPGERFSHHLGALYLRDGIDGIQHVKRNTTDQGWQILHSNVRSSYRAGVASLDYALTANSGAGYKWKAGALVRYRDKEDLYLLPRSSKSAANLLFAVNGKAVVYRSARYARALLLGAAAGTSRNLSGAYSYAGANAAYKVVTDLEQVDLNYLVSSYYFAGGDVTYSRKARETGRATLYLKGAVNYRESGSSAFDHRALVQLSIGCTY